MLVEKHLAGKYQSKVIGALLCLLEVGSPLTEAVQAALMIAVQHKIPKLKAGGAKAAVEAMRLLGDVLDLKELTPSLPELMDHRDKAVRDEGTALFAMMRRARGDDPLFKQLKGIKKGGFTEQRLTELKETALPEPVAPTYKRQRQGAAGAAGAAGADASEDGADGEQPAVDAFAQKAAQEAAEPFDLLGKMPRKKGSATLDLWEKSLSAEKWQERKAAADEVSKLAEGKPLLCQGDYSEVAKGLATLAKNGGGGQNQYNAAVMTSAVKAMGALAVPLKQAFAKHALKLAPVLIEKGADKNMGLTIAVRQVLGVFTSAGCVTFAEAVAISAAKGATTANPRVKQTAMHWIMDVLDGADASTVDKAADSLSAVLLTLTDDGLEEVRKEAFECVAKVARSLEERQRQAWLARLPAKKAERVQKLLGGGAAAAPAATPAAHAPAPSAAAPPAAVDATAAPPATARPATAAASAVRRPATAASKTQRPASARAGSGTAAAAAAPKKPAAAKGAENEWQEPSLPPLEELEQAWDAEGLVGADVLKKLLDKDWKERKTGLEMLDAAAAALPEERRTPLLALLALWKMAPSAAEKNVQVQLKMLEVVQHVAATFPLLPRRAAARVLDFAANQLAVKQTKPAAAEALLAVAEACSASWTLGKVRDAAQAQKNPKVFHEALVWAREAVEAFSLKALARKEVAEFAMAALEPPHRDPLVREAAVQLLVTLHRADGPRLLESPLLKDLKEVSKKAIADSVAKLPAAQAKLPPPSRFFRHGALQHQAAAAAPSTPGGSAAAAAAESAAALDELSPRVDVMPLVAKKLEALRSTNWKERDAALKEVLQVLKDHPRVTPGVGALIDALKPRLADNQLVLALGAHEALGLIGSALGKNTKLHLEAAVPSMLLAFGDGKQQVRDAARRAVERWVAEASIEPMLKYALKALGMEAPAGRALLLEWLTRYVQNGLSCGHAEVQPLLKPLLVNLDHRSKEVRSAAEATLEALLGWGLPCGMLDEPLSRLDRATGLKLQAVLTKLRQKTQQGQPPAAPASSLTSASMPNLHSARTVPAPAKPAAAAAAARPGSARPGTASARGAPGAVHERSPLATKPAANDPLPAKSPRQPKTPRAEAPKTPRSAAKEETPAAKLAAAISVLQSHKSGSSQLQKAIVEVNAMLQAAPELLLPKMEMLIAALSEKLKQALSPTLQQDAMVSRKLVAFTMELTKAEPVMSRLGEGAVQMLLLGLIEPLANSLKAPQTEHATLLLSSFNIMTLQTLQHSPRELITCVALRLLQERARQRSQKEFLELLIKCLMKLVKAMAAQPLAAAEATPILRQLHELFETLPASAAVEPPSTPGTDPSLVGRVREAADVLLRQLVAQSGADAIPLLEAAVSLDPPPFVLRRILQLQQPQQPAQSTPPPPPPPPPPQQAAAKSPAAPAAAATTPRRLGTPAAPTSRQLRSTPKAAAAKPPTPAADGIAGRLDAAAPDRPLEEALSRIEMLKNEITGGADSGVLGVRSNEQARQEPSDINVDVHALKRRLANLKPGRPAAA